MTLEQMASAIRNDVGSGLREVDDFAYSIEQLYDEILNVWNSIVYKTSVEDPTQLTHFAQKVDDIELTFGKMPSDVHGYHNIIKCSINKLAMTADNNGLLYIGTNDFNFSFARYYKPEDVKNHQYSRVIKNRPFMYVDMVASSDGKQDIYFFNMQDNNLQHIMVRAVFENPLKTLEDEGINAEGEEFPAPKAIQEQIIETLTNKYIKYYRQLNPGYQPNTNRDNR